MKDDFRPLDDDPIILKRLQARGVEQEVQWPWSSPKGVALVHADMPQV